MKHEIVGQAKHSISDSDGVDAGCRLPLRCDTRPPRVCGITRSSVQAAALRCVRMQKRGEKAV